MKETFKSPDPQHERYSELPFPPYRYIVGASPHPTEDPQGHSFGKEEKEPGNLTRDTWHNNETYLYGVDLYNYAYWWEAHEAFESLWKKKLDDELMRHFLQGLIKMAAAFLKWYLKQQRGLDYLYDGALKHFNTVREYDSTYMGLDLDGYFNKVHHHFVNVVHRDHHRLSRWPDPLKNYPFIILKN